MTPLPDQPKIVVMKDKTPEGEVTLRLATNISPETEVILVETPEAFDELSKGLPFANGE